MATTDFTTLLPNIGIAKIGLGTVNSGSQPNPTGITEGVAGDLLVSGGPGGFDSWLAASAAAPAIITLTGDVTGSGTTTVATTIANDAVTTVKIADSSVTAIKIADDTITNTEINASAAIAYSKLNLTSSVVNADIAPAAAIAFSKLTSLSSANILLGSAGNVATSTAVTGDVTINNTGITAIATGVIVNADISGSAAIDRTKLANGTANTFVTNNSSGVMQSLAVTASRAVVTNSSGQPVAATTTAAEIGFVNGLPFAITSYVPQGDLNPSVQNIGVSYASGTFTILGANGSALSTTNPGYVVIGSQANPGRMVRLTITSNQSFNDDAFAGTSDIAGEEFGTKAGTAWSNDRPFFLYAINRDDTGANLLFGISPCPSFELSPSSTSLIGYKLTPSTTPSDSSIWLLGSSLTTSNYTSRPVLRIGGIRMRKVVTTDDWTVQTLSTKDGIKLSNYENTSFNFTAGECAAAAASSFFVGATPPTWANGNSSIVANYFLTMSGLITINFDTTAGGNCTNGTGTTALQIGAPIASSPFVANYAGFGFLRNTGAGTTTNSLTVQSVVSPPIIEVFDALPSTTNVAHNSFSNTGADIRINALQYKGFAA